MNKREHKKDVEKLRGFQEMCRRAGLKNALCLTNPKRILENYAKEREEQKRTVKARTKNTTKAK